jgi:hypothetical protein
MRAIGTAGAAVTIKRHDAGCWRGLAQAKGWQGRRPACPDPASDKRYGAL